MRRVSTFAVLVTLVGCRIDSVTFIQGGNDAAPDVAIDTPTPPATHHHFVVDRLLFPTNNTEAKAFGLDLDGDGMVDNQLGMIAGALGAQGIENQIYTDKLIDTGGAITLLDVGADDLTTESYANFAIYQGANPMPAPCLNAQDMTCRKHFTGSGSFTAKPTPVNPPLVGAIDAGKLVAGPGHLALQFIFFGSTALQLTLLGARVELLPTTTTTGKLTGAITKSDVDNVLIPSMHAGFQPIVTRDCTMLTTPPGCGCMASSQGQSLIQIFDASHDCAISLSEVRDNSLIVSLFAPDVTVEGQQALSAGFSVHAVGATYTAP